MKITNKLGVPDIIFRFLSYDNYDYNPDPNVFSATTFNKPIREIILTRRHDKSVEVDAMDSLWRVFGSAVHAALEKITGPDIEPIRRLYAKIAGATVSGKFDLIQDNKIKDFKITSVWSLVFNSRIEEWRLQLSIYRYLYKAETSKVLEATGYIIAILRDWSQRDTGRNNYPRSPIVELAIPLLSFEEVEAELTAKIKMLQLCDQMADDDLPQCTDAERWLNKKTGEYNKCEKYCQAYKFCNQAGGLKNAA